MEHVFAPVQTLLRHVRQKREIGNLPVFAAHIPGLERLVAFAQKRGLAQFPGKRVVFRHGDIGRQGVERGGFVRDDRADSRIIAALHHAVVARQHPLRGGLMVVAARHLRTAERVDVGDLRHFRHHAREANPCDSGGNRAVLAPDFLRRIGFGIKSVVMGQAAAEIDQQNVFGFCLLRGLVRHVRRRLRRFQTQHVRQRQSQHRQRAQTQKVAA